MYPINNFIGYTKLSTVRLSYNKWIITKIKQKRKSCTKS